MEDPIIQFNTWFEAAHEAGMIEPNAMILSTVSELGKPSSRVVLLKEYNATGFVFFTNYNSRKAKDIMSNHHAALLFYWKGLERQIRIEGIVKKTTEDESGAYFHSRPFESKLSAVASPQSAVIPDKAFLTTRIKALMNDNVAETLERPLYWGGFRLIPDYFEFWQSGEHRLHDRRVFELKDGEWEKCLLAP